MLLLLLLLMKIALLSAGFRGIFASSDSGECACVRADLILGI